jgi:hypothetical protein
MNPQNKPTRLSLAALIAALLIILAACSPVAPTPAETPVEVLQTQAASTVIAEVTQDALLTPSPTPTPAPSNTPTPPPAADTQTATPSATPTQTVAPTVEFDLVFEDRFAGSQSWAVQSGEDFGFGYVNDGYRIYVNLVNAAIWSLRGSGTLSDVRVETEARRLDGPIDGYYGVVCRHTDEDNYYALMISDDLSYGIASMANGDFEFLFENRDTFDVIQPGQENRIRAECVGNRISLFVNGTEMVSLQDNTHQSGSTGLVAKTRLAPEFQALYTYFAISTPR